MQASANSPAIASLPGFPPARDGVIETPASLTGRGFFLRRATTPDLPWLSRLYASTRTDEMAQVPWPEPVKQAFLAEQFSLQHRHYVARYSDCDFLILETNAGPIGRYYVQRAAPDYLLVDISISPDARNQGVGRALIQASQSEAAADGRGMQLHVLQSNAAALRLYERLGFVIAESEGMHHRMQWKPFAAA